MVGKVFFFWAGGSKVPPGECVVCAPGNVHVVGSMKRRVQSGAERRTPTIRRDSDCAKPRASDSDPPDDDELSGPMGVALGSKGHIYIADSGANVIRYGWGQEACEEQAFLADSAAKRRRARLWRLQAGFTLEARRLERTAGAWEMGLCVVGMFTDS